MQFLIPYPLSLFIRFMLIPQLTTDRLLLRALQADDFELYAEMMASDQVTRFLGEGRPLSRVDAWRQMAMIIGHWQLRGFGLWAVEERDTGEFLGWFHLRPHDNGPPNEPELGYRLLPRDRHQVIEQRHRGTPPLGEDERVRRQRTKHPVGEPGLAPRLGLRTAELLGREAGVAARGDELRADGRRGDRRFVADRLASG